MKTDREFLDGIYRKAALLENSLEKELIIAPKPAFWSLPSFKVTVVTAAAFLLVLMPGVMANQSYAMEIPQGYTMLEPEIDDVLPENQNEVEQHSVSDDGETVNPQTGEPSGEMPSDEVPLAEEELSAQAAQPFMAPRAIAAEPEPIEMAAVICAASVTKIEKSVYDKENNQITTTVAMKTTETFKGEPAKKIDVVVEGGYDVKTKTYQEYQVTFAKGEDVLVFLTPSFENAETYILSGGEDGKYTCDTGDSDKLYVNYKGLAVSCLELKEKIEKLNA